MPAKATKKVRISQSLIQLVRIAVQGKIRTWNALRAIEKSLGKEIDDMEDSIEAMAIECDYDACELSKDAIVYALKYWREKS